MSQVIDTKVVEMQFDNSKFEKNIEVSLNSLKFLNKNIDEAGKNRGSLDGLAKAGDQVGIAFDNMNMKSKISLNMFDMLAGVGTKAFNRISDAVAGFALNMANSLSGMQAMRDGFNEYELKMGSVQTILAGAKILDSNGNNIENEAKRLDIVNQKLEDLNAYSDKTIYSFKDMTANIGKFTNAGVNLDDSVQAIQGVANVAAVSGANASEASRAMYNFSQALSSGAVKLIDWKSIENANMATVEFKQQLLDTAVAMGTVIKKGEKYKTTTTDNNGKTSDWFNSTMKFNDALGNQWMTTEVLTQTLKNYSTDVNEMTAAEVEEYKAKLKSIGYTDKQVEGIVKLSKKAFAAATEVKTFSQMIDTLKESLGSGWAQTWETIFGDFNESKKLWTDLNNTIDGILSPIGKARNAMLKIWKEDGGRDAMIQSFKNLHKAITTLIAPIKNVWDALTPGTKRTGKVLATISKDIEKFTRYLIKGAGVAAKVLGKLLQPVIFIGRAIEKVASKAISLFRSTLPKILKYLSPVTKSIDAFSKSVSKAFDKHIVSRIKTFYTSFSKAFDSLKKRIGNSAIFENLIKLFSDLSSTLQNLFGSILIHIGSVASKVSSYIGRIWKAVSPLFSSAITKAIQFISETVLPKFRRALSTVADKFSEFRKALGKIDIKNSKFYKGVVEFPDKLEKLANNKTIKTITSSIKAFGSEAIEFLSTKFSALKSNIDSIKMPNGLRDLFDNIRNFIKSIFGKDSIEDNLADTMEDAANATEKVTGEKSGEKLTAFQKFLEGVSDAFNWLKTAAGHAKDAIKDFIDFVKTNTPKALKSFHDFLAGEDGVLQISDIVDVAYAVSDAFSTLLTSLGFSKIGDAAKGISDAFGDLSESIVVLAKRAGNKMNMSALRDFAIGVGILVGAMWVLSKIPTDKLVIVSGVILGLGYALSKFFGLISSGKANLAETAGFIPIAILLIAMSGAMLAIAASVGILVGVLAIFPKVIKQYNNLGDEFQKGMERVKEVLEQIFEYLDHAASSKYSFRSAMALLGLVAALSKLRKVIVKFANKKTGESMEEGLSRISQVLGMLGSFLSGIQLGSFSFINIGIDLDTVGMAAMILALAFMIDKITPAIEKMSKLSPDEYKMAFKVLELIFFEVGSFVAGAALISKFTGTGLGQWLGIAATVTLLASAISSAVSSIETLAKIQSDNPEGLKKALQALGGIFFAFGLLLMIIGDLKPTASLGTLFGLSLVIGVLTFCVIALVPIAQSHPDALLGAVVAVGTLMLALGVTMSFMKSASGKVGLKDVLVLLGITIAMGLLAQQIRRLAKTGGSAGGIVAAGLAIGIAALAIAGAMKILGSIQMISPMVLAGLALLALAIWGVAYAIQAFKGTSGQMSEGSEAVKEGIENMSSGANEAISNLGMSLDISGLLDTIGSKIGEKIRNFNLGEHIRNMIEQVKADVVNWAQDFIDIGTNLVEGISTAISNPANVEKVKSCIVELGKALLDSFKLFFGINSPSTVMAEQGGFVLDGLAKGLMEYPTKLADWVSGIGEFILGGVGKFFDGAVEKGQNLIGGIGEGIQNGKEVVITKASAFGKSVLDKVGKAKDWASKAAGSVKAYASKISHGAKEAKGAAGEVASNTIDSVKDVASRLGEHASNAANQFSAKLRSGIGMARSASLAIVNSAKSAFAGIRSSFLTYGQNAAQGFRAGITSLISSVAEKAREMVRRAKEAAQSEQNSNSPSKDFMKYGGWAAQGYAIGLSNRKSTNFIKNNVRKMVDAAKDVASTSFFGVGPLSMDSDQAVRSLAYAIGQISDTLDDTVDSNPTIKPVIDMSNISNSAADISSIFRDRHISAGVDIARSISDDFETRRSNNEMINNSIRKLTNKIGSMTDTMNSRSLNNYITVDGSTDPTTFADELVRSFRLNARTI